MIEPLSADNADQDMIVHPPWEIDASPHLSVQERAKIRKEYEVISPVLLPVWKIDASLANDASFIALAVTLRLPTDASQEAAGEAAGVLTLFDEGEKTLGGKGLVVDRHLCRVTETSITVVLKPNEPRGASFRLQTLIEPLAGAGLIATWSVSAAPTSHAIVARLADEVGRPRSALLTHPQSLASLHDMVRAEVIIVDPKAPHA